MLLGRFQNLVENAVFLGVFGVHPEISLGVFLDLFDILARMVGKDRVETLAQPENLLSLDLDVGGLSLGAANGLMHVDRGVGQGIALALGAGGQQHRAKRGGHTHGDRADRVADHLHRVVDCQARVDLAARRVDIHLDRGLAVFFVQVQQLGHDDVGNLIVNRGAHKDDPVFEQQRENIINALAASAAFDHSWD